MKKYKVKIFAGAGGKLMNEQTFLGPSSIDDMKNYMKKFRNMNFFYKIYKNDKLVKANFINEDIYQNSVFHVDIYAEPGMIKIASKSFAEDDEKDSLKKVYEFINTFKENNVNYFRVFRNHRLINQGTIV